MTFFINFYKLYFQKFSSTHSNLSKLQLVFLMKTCMHNQYSLPKSNFFNGDPTTKKSTFHLQQIGKNGDFWLHVSNSFCFAFCLPKSFLLCSRQYSSTPIVERWWNFGFSETNYPFWARFLHSRQIQLSLRGNLVQEHPSSNRCLGRKPVQPHQWFLRLVDHKRNGKSCAFES